MVTTPSTVLADATIDTWQGRLHGQLLRPGDDRYEHARRVWNGHLDRRPALIVRCPGVADVIEAVHFARGNDLLVAVRGGAHNAAGHATCDGGIVLDLTPMKGIRVDPARRTAQAQAGLLWGEFDRETQVFGLATTGGTVSNTGISGLTLGGGEGWLQGKYGLTIDNLLSADVVTADGTCLHASATEHVDLFWGLRGGGGNFGIVTSFAYRLHEVGPLVLGGMVIHPLAKAREVRRFAQEFFATMPDEAMIFPALVTTPDGMPAAVLLLGYSGPLAEGERVLAPARTFGPPLADLVQPMPYVVRQTLNDEAFGTHGVQRYWKSGDARTLSDALIEVMMEGAMTVTSPMSAMAIAPFWGASARVAPEATAFGLRANQWDVNVVAQWVDPAESEQHMAWARKVWEHLEPLTGGTAYINHIAGDDRPEKVRASYGPNYERLMALKNQYDPTNLFRLNPNIRPRV